ncbi:MAG: hypothetical protein UHK60_10160 [Acutalibacteraceae bacterium]|nr:hypothetical protein [Acutalibacteraceae bacterium]
MRDFDNYSNDDKEFDQFYNNNPNTDRYSEYNNYNNTFNSNYNNDAYSSNNNYNNNYNNNRYSENRAYHNNDYYGMDYNEIYNEASGKLWEWCKQNKKKIIKFIISIFLIWVGVFILSIALAIVSFEISGKSRDVSLFFYLIISILIGVFLLLYQPIRKYKKKKVCKYSVKATVVGFKETISHSKNGISKLFSPEYEFYYKGKTYIVEEKSSRNIALPKLGDKFDMLINEENPNDFYVSSISVNMIFVISGLIFFIIGAGGILLSM